MLFPTVSFAIFFIVTFLLYWISTSSSLLLSHRRPLANHLRKLLLLAASYVFYGTWDWRFLPLLIGSSLFNYVCALFLLRLHRSWDRAGQAKLGARRESRVGRAAGEQNNQEEKRTQSLQRLARWAIGLAIGFNLAVLIFFKYINWFLVNLNTLLNAVNLPLVFSQVTIILPLGISFFTFQNISFLIDIYRRRLPQRLSYLDYSLYIAFFPQLIAGPIVRAGSILPQLQRLPNPQNIYLSDAFSRILIGLFKKVFIANTLSTSFVDPIFLVPSAHSSLELLLAAYSYGVVIYCDFSAYSDMAVGLGLLCGIRLMENFDRPYARSSLQGFWRSWHISLSTWLRDYLYIPLGGSRQGNRYLNTLLTMSLGGLWHGASWTFLLWGALHGAMISIENFVRQRRLAPPYWQASDATKRLGPRLMGSKLMSKLMCIGGWLYCFHFVTLTWILFRAPNFSVAGEYFATLLRFDFSNAGSLTNIAIITMVLGLLPQIFLPKGTTLLTKALDALPIAAQVLVFACSVALLQVVLPEGVAPFIYYQF